MITRTGIQNSAKKLLGAKWCHQGRSLEAGIDCIGGLIFVALDNKYCTPEEMKEIDSLDYRRTPTTYELLIQKLNNYFDEIPIYSSREGDVLTFRMNGERLTSHVGIIIRGEREFTLIHSLENKVTIEEPLRRWNKYITHAFQFRGVVD